MQNGETRTDLLAELDSIDVNRQEIISQADHKYCRQQQTLLHECLDKLQARYRSFEQDTDLLEGKLRVHYKTDGSIHVDSYNYGAGDNEHYDHYDWLPFQAMNRIAELYLEACNCFARRIVNYFNETYHVTVPPKEFDKHSFLFGTRPEYTDYVDHVISYLDGESFRHKAEWEILRRFLDAVKRTYAKVPELKGQTISFYEVADIGQTFRGDLYLSNNIIAFCAGIALASDDRLDGGEKTIEKFDKQSIDLTRWYRLKTTKAQELKFYKNGRIDVRFVSKTAAFECFNRLKLYTLKQDRA